MTLQLKSLQRITKAAPTPFGAGAQTFDAGLSHPDLNQFVNELDAASPDAGQDQPDAPESSPSRRRGERSA